MDLQSTLQLKVHKGIELSNDEMDCLKYLLEEFKEWKNLKDIQT